jgi:hypothetical protein
MDVVSKETDCAGPVAILQENERKRREAVWELFQSETVFLIDHLMVLKHVSWTQVVYVVRIVGDRNNSAAA